MSVKKVLIEIGYDKNAEFDFGISCEICDLNVEHMNELRAMIVCAIGTAEDMFRREIERRNPACQAEAPKLSDFADHANTRIYSPESPEEK